MKKRLTEYRVHEIVREEIGREVRQKAECETCGCLVVTKPANNKPEMALIPYSPPNGWQSYPTFEHWERVDHYFCKLHHPDNKKKPTKKARKK